MEPCLVKYKDSQIKYKIIIQGQELITVMKRIILKKVFHILLRTFIISQKETKLIY